MLCCQKEAKLEAGSIAIVSAVSILRYTCSKEGRNIGQAKDGILVESEYNYQHV